MEQLKSIYTMASIGGGEHEVQAAVDGFLDENLSEQLAELPWPESQEVNFYKQLFVLRAGSK